MIDDNNCLIVVDIGNTNIVMGVYQNKELKKIWRIETLHAYIADEFYLTVKSLISKNLTKKPTAALICSVVPDITKNVITGIKKIGCDKIFELTDVHKIGMRIKIDNPQELGMDRLVNAYAAFLKYKTSLIVIDYGTATTFDIVNSSGEYIGGVISAGLKLSLKALVENTAKLTMIPLEAPKSVIGKNTVNSMQSGLMLGYALMCDGLVDKITSEIKDKPLVVVTGGLAKIMHTLINRIDHLEEDLTIWGLKEIYYRFFAN